MTEVNKNFTQNAQHLEPTHRVSKNNKSQIKSDFDSLMDATENERESANLEKKNDESIHPNISEHSAIGQIKNIQQNNREDKNLSKVGNKLNQTEKTNCCLENKKIEKLLEDEISKEQNDIFIGPGLQNTPTHIIKEEPLLSSTLNTQQLIDKIYEIAKQLIHKAEICIDKKNNSFTISILESFLKNTEITLSATEKGIIISFQPMNADQYQFLQKEKEKLRKKINENNKDASIDILIDEP